jgi:hypothetical protein
LFELRQCNPDVDTSWSTCDIFYKGIIKNTTISNGAISFDVEDNDYRDQKSIPEYTVSDYVTKYRPLLTTGDIPKDSANKIVPIQFGNLNDPTNGIFAKGVSISSKVGLQELLYDSASLGSMDSIGLWDSGVKRYFTAKETSVANGITQKEFKISYNSNIPTYYYYYYYYY